MMLNAQQKDALEFQLARLLEYDEPAAFLATLQRIAERKAYAGSRAPNWQEANKWQELADACAKVGQAYEAAARSQLVSKSPV